jgi:hypothetical protein
MVTFTEIRLPRLTAIFGTQMTLAARLVLDRLWQERLSICKA